MTTYHLMQGTPAELARDRALWSASKLNPPTGSSRYPGARRSRRVLVAAAVFSSLCHAGIFFGIGPPKKKAGPPVQEQVIELSLTMPNLKELEEPEPDPVDNSGEALDFGVVVPMQMDLPRLPQIGDFVQQLDFSTFEKPDPNQSKMWAIPGAIRRGGKIGDGMGNIFNLKDLDRPPEPVLQPAPVYPANLRKEGLRATVMVEFIVDTVGNVVNATAADSSHMGFESAAVTGVLKWKFRPGMRAGRKVNTRLQVPIIFSVRDDLD
ncbi:MAG TPA: energy transducer TonB [Opitutaceae bacterium]|nr:energy transducer TonB [Opitutaceae bacterium]